MHQVVLKFIIIIALIHTTFIANAQQMTKQEMANKISELEEHIYFLKDQMQQMESPEKPTEVPAVQSSAEPIVPVEDPQEPENFFIWNNGLRFNIADKVQLRLGGRIQNDWFIPLEDGPASLQAEYMISDNNSAMGGFPDTTFDGWYIFGSYFLTGESRGWKGSRSALDRVKPNHPFLVEENGIGAWEIALRYSELDLNDNNIIGGKLNDITTALNWYPTANTRLMMNYVFADVDNPVLAIDDEEHLFLSRFQIVF